MPDAANVHHLPEGRPIQVLFVRSDQIRSDQLPRNKRQPTTDNPSLRCSARIAVFAFSGVIPRLAPAEAFKRLMSGTISPNHSPAADPGSFEGLVAESATRAAFDKAAPQLRAAFKAFATSNGRLYLRDFLRLLSAAGAKAPPPVGLGLSHNAALKVLVVGSFDETEEGAGNTTPLDMDASLLDTDMLWSEFLGALGHLALSIKPADIPDAALEPAEGGEATDSAASPNTDTVEVEAKEREVEKVEVEATRTASAPSAQSGDERPATAASVITDATEPEPVSLGGHLEVMFKRLKLSEAAKSQSSRKRGVPRRPRA